MTKRVAHGVGVLLCVWAFDAGGIIRVPIVPYIVALVALAEAVLFIADVGRGVRDQLEEG